MDLSEPAELGSGDAGVLPDDAALSADAPDDVLVAPPDLARPDAPLLAKGKACAAGPQCQSGLCVDKICCDLACTGICQACDIAGAEGTCTAIKASDDPDNECDPEPIATCGLDGTCDGTGACRRYAANTVCAPGSCSGSTETSARTCSSAGVCQPATTRSCANGLTCMGNTCGSMCAIDGDCQPGFFCDNQTCKLKNALGTACTSKVQCASDACTDGVCCNIACDQTCYACDLPGSEGTCNPVPEGQERGAAPECSMQAAATCGRLGGCNGRGACRLHPMGTACGAQSCSGSTESAAPVCNGNGACDPAVTRDCGAYLCSGITCSTTCTGSADCKTGHHCAGVMCRPTKLTRLVVHDTVAANVLLWSLQTNFQIGLSGAHPWGEQAWIGTFIVSVEAAGTFLLGKEWIKVATESKRYTGGPQATITLAAPSNVYLPIDDRWGTPSWITGWTAAGFKIAVYESASRPALPFTVYRKTNQTGDVPLPRIGANTAYNYFVIVD